MKRVSFGFMVVPLLSMLLSFGCGQGAVSQVTAAPVKPTTAPVASADKEWADILAQARKEGTVSLYNTAWPAPTRTALTQPLKEKYGINLEFSPFSRGAELMAKVQLEERASMYLADIFGAGGTTLIASMKPASLLAPMEPLLFLPEVKDAGRWAGSKVPFLDKDKLAIGMLANIERNIVINTDLVKPGEITTFKDLLKPQYKGKITLNDPSVSGTGNALFTFLATNIWNLEETRQFLKQLVEQQQAVIERDQRQHVETVARGKYAIGVGAASQFVGEFLKASAPIDSPIMKDGTLVTPSAGALGVPHKMAHPNAARVFINWLLSKEGQTVLTKNWGTPSLRSDVPTEGFVPLFLPKPGEKLFVQNEETILFQGKMLEIAKEIIAQTR